MGFSAFKRASSAVNTAAPSLQAPKTESTVSPSPDLEAVYESETNSNGVVLFDLNNIYQPGQSGVAILKVNAEKNDKTGTAIIELSKESNNQLDIVIE